MGRDPLPFESLVAPKPVPHSDPEHDDYDDEGDGYDRHPGRADVTDDVLVYTDEVAR